MSQTTGGDDDPDSGKSNSRPHSALRPPKSRLKTTKIVAEDAQSAGNGNKAAEARLRLRPLRKPKPKLKPGPKLEPKALQFQNALLKFGISLPDASMRVLMTNVPSNMNVNQFSAAIQLHIKRFGSVNKAISQMFNIQKFLNNAINNFMKIQGACDDAGIKDVNPEIIQKAVIFQKKTNIEPKALVQIMNSLGMLKGAGVPPKPVAFNEDAIIATLKGLIKHNPSSPIVPSDAASLKMTPGAPPPQVSSATIKPPNPTDVT